MPKLEPSVRTAGKPPHSWRLSGSVTASRRPRDAISDRITGRSFVGADD